MQSISKRGGIPRCSSSSSCRIGRRIRDLRARRLALSGNGPASRGSVIMPTSPRLSFQGNTARRRVRVLAPDLPRGAQGLPLPLARLARAHRRALAPNGPSSRCLRRRSTAGQPARRRTPRCRCHSRRRAGAARSKDQGATDRDRARGAQRPAVQVYRPMNGAHSRWKGTAAMRGGRRSRYTRYAMHASTVYTVHITLTLYTSLVLSTCPAGPALRSSCSVGGLRRGGAAASRPCRCRR